MIIDKFIISLRESQIYINMAQSHQDLINFLQQNDFKANCPTCGEGFKLKEASLFSVDNFNTQAKKLLNEKKE